jgi:Na+-transporting methylmalonyl-CoA/oxaloacetate decarboxylase gamma subunit
MGWHLVTTLVTDRLLEQVDRAAGEGLATADEAVASLERELHATLHSSEAAQIGIALQQRQDLDRNLHQNVRADVVREVTSFHERSAIKLSGELKTLRSKVDEIIRHDDPTRSWSAIQAKIRDLAAVVVVDYLESQRQLADVIAATLASSNLSPTALGLADLPPIPRLDQPYSIDSLRPTDRARTSNADIVRTGVGGLMTGAGGATILTTAALGSVVLPLSLAAAAVGMGAAVKSSVDKRRSTDVSDARREAGAAANRYVGEIDEALRQHRADYKRDVAEWVDRAINAQLKSLQAQIQSEIQQLKVAEQDGEAGRNERAEEIRQIIEQVGKLRAQFERILHTLARPELQPVHP